MTTVTWRHVWLLRSKIYPVTYYFTDADVIEEIKNRPPGSGDFSPFPSKLFFLLYVLINSPRPLVSLTNENKPTADIHVHTHVHNCINMKYRHIIICIVGRVQSAVRVFLTETAECWCTQPNNSQEISPAFFYITKKGMWFCKTFVMAILQIKFSIIVPHLKWNTILCELYWNSTASVFGEQETSWKSSSLSCETKWTIHVYFVVLYTNKHLLLSLSNYYLEKFIMERGGDKTGDISHQWP